MTYEDFNIEGIKLTNTGDQLAVCPRCSNERKKKGLKTLSVNVGLGVWNCHHCGQAGSILKGWNGDEPENDTEFLPIPKRESTVNLGEKEIAWFKSRGISLFTLERNKVTKASVWMPQTKKEENCLCFNYYEDDKIVNVKYRDAAKNFRQVKDAKKILYKLNDLKDVNFCIICEGEIDALSWEEAKIKNAVSVPDGAPNPNSKNTDTKFTYLETCASQLEGIDKYYLSVDTDPPGKFLLEELSRRLGKHKCWIVKYPGNCKDANEVLVKYGPEELRECFDVAEPYPINDIILVQDFSDDIDLLYENGYDTGVTVGFNESSSNLKPFDELIMFKTSMFAAVTGIPSHGKSNFVEQLAMLLNVNHKWKAGIFSPEHYPMNILFSRISRMYVGKPFFKGYRSRMSRSELEAAKNHFNSNYYFIRPKDDNFNLESILDAAAGLVLRYGVKVIIIDPWNTITHDKNKMSETDYTEYALNKINDFKQKYDVLIFVIAHPTKMQKDDDGKFKIPNLYSISGSAHWYNKCDYGITIYRDFDRKEVQVHIQKVKHEHLGNVGMALFEWNPNNSRYFPKGTPPFDGRYNEPRQVEIVNYHEPIEEISSEDAPF